MTRNLLINFSVAAEDVGPILADISGRVNNLNFHVLEDGPKPAKQEAPLAGIREVRRRLQKATGTKKPIPPWKIAARKKRNGNGKSRGPQGGGDRVFPRLPIEFRAQLVKTLMEGEGLNPSGVYPLITRWKRQGKVAPAAEGGYRKV